MDNGRTRVDFLVVGAQKAGTTALDLYLRRHPEIGMAPVKELHFFDDEALFAGPEVDYGTLERQFDRRDGIRCYGEATPIYLYWEPAMRRIWEYNREMKLVAILRNPVDRAFSHWTMEVGRSWEQDDFLHCIRHERERAREALPLQHRVRPYVDRGFYAEQIRRVQRFFPEDQVLFLKYEDYRRDQAAAVTRVLEFLGVDPAMYRFEPRQVLAGRYARTMSAAEKGLLLEVFRNDVREVERLLGWDCGDWMT